MQVEIDAPARSIVPDPSAMWVLLAVSHPTPHTLINETQMFLIRLNFEELRMSLPTLFARVLELDAPVSKLDVDQSFQSMDIGGFLGWRSI